MSTGTIEMESITDTTKLRQINLLDGSVERGVPAGEPNR